MVEVASVKVASHAEPSKQIRYHGVRVIYARVNPRQARGDDLMCLCPLDARNWLAVATASAQRALRRVAPVSG